jgi:monofunctional biosynthetic peptidoglycan transglycosylase
MAAVLRRLFIAAVIAIIAFGAFEWITFPDTAILAKEPPKTTAFIELRKDELRAAGHDDHIDYRFVPYAQISPYLRRAVLVAEDSNFYEHEAVDTKAMKEAIQRDWSRRRLTHGGSTITQQLAKNLYLSPSRNPFRKVKEYFIARSLENHLTKKRILELYLNVVEMGERVYGAEAASRFYFQKSAADLTPQQAALLAGCLPNPRLMNPGDANKRLRSRQRMILSRLRRWGYLFETEVLTEKKPDAAPAVDTALEQAPPTDTATTDTATTSTETTTPTSTAGTQSPEPTATTTETPAPPKSDTTSTTTAPGSGTGRSDQ